MNQAPVIDPRPLSDLLRRVARELRVLQGEGRSLEDAIGRAILGEEPSTRETLAHLQGVDLIVQTLGELSDYVEAMTGMITPDPVIDVSAPLARISLRELARNLSGGSRQPIVDQDGQISGEVDLF